MGTCLLYMGIIVHFSVCYVLSNARGTLLMVHQSV